VKILCCPACRGDLSLEPVREDGREVLEGTLHCSKCKRSYPVRDGIPDLLLG